MLPAPDDPRFQELAQGGFTFACHPGVPCFNQCCRRLQLMLTPYDLLRLRQHLGMSSSAFLESHCLVENGQNGWPLPRLKMRDDAEGTCPFLAQDGCTVYPHRPGACRTYPLGRAAKGGGDQDGPSQEQYFLVREEHCQGFSQGQDWTPQQWIQDQGLEPYNQVNDLFLPLITRQAPPGDPAQIQQKMQMFFMACYNLEAFANFLEKSSLTRRFVIEPQRLEQMAAEELELLKFAFQWLRLAIFGDPTLELRQA